MDVVDNTGDNFSYIVLHFKHWNDILAHYCPTTLVYSVVHSRYIELSESPTCVESVDAFKIYNRHGEDLFRTEKMKT